MLNQLRFKNLKTVDSSCQGGYIALMSALIISAILLMISVSLGMGGFFTRFNVLSGEYKLTSEQLAQGCLEKAKVLLALNPYADITGSLNIGGNSCNIVSLTADDPQGGQTTIQTSAIVHDSVANIKAVINSANFSLISINYY